MDIYPGARPRFAYRKTWLIAFRTLALLTALIAGPAAAQQARITGLTDMAFGTVSVTTDQQSTESICVYSSSATKHYTVTARGSGANSAFALQAGTASLSYNVQWAGSAGQASGTALTAGTASTAFTSTALASGCILGPTTSATLIVILPATYTGVAVAGAYSGTLYITITPQ